MRSMTGYGKGQSASAGAGITAEIKTVNHKFLDVSIRLPRTMSSLEIPLRKRLAERFFRGRVDLAIAQDTQGAQAALVYANLPLALEYAQAAKQIAQAAGIKGTLKLSTLLTLPEVLSLSSLEPEAETLLASVLEAVDTACDQVVADREREGEQLKTFLTEHLNAVNATLDELARAAHNQPLQAHEKLVKRLAGLPEVQADPQSLAQELALFSDRCDITEEINRLRAHCQQMQEHLNSDKPVGREMDFLAQEMNRESNTICSKSASLEVTRLGLACKTETDRIREQIQNVE